MPFRFEPNHWRERAAQMRALALDTQTPNPPRSCSSWRKTTTSLQIALNCGRAANHGQRKGLAAINSRALEPCTRRSFAIGVAPEAPDDDEDAIPAIGRRCSAISTLCTASSKPEIGGRR
jgi:hypothetical protein